VALSPGVEGGGGGRRPWFLPDVGEGIRSQVTRAVDGIRNITIEGEVGKLTITEVDPASCGAPAPHFGSQHLGGEGVQGGVLRGQSAASCLVETRSG